MQHPASEPHEINFRGDRTYRAFSTSFHTLTNLGTIVLRRKSSGVRLRCKCSFVRESISPAMGTSECSVISMKRNILQPIRTSRPPSERAHVRAEQSTMRFTEFTKIVL